MGKIARKILAEIGFIKIYIEFYSNLELENKNYYQDEFIKDKVHLYVNTKTKKNDYFETTFYKYIPFEIKEVSDIIQSRVQIYINENS